MTNLLLDLLVAVVIAVIIGGPVVWILSQERRQSRLYDTLKRRIKRPEGKPRTPPD